jgi:hypothetical protein
MWDPKKRNKKISIGPNNSCGTKSLNESGGWGVGQKKAWFWSSLINLLICGGSFPRNWTNLLPLKLGGYLDYIFFKNSQKIQKLITIFCLNFSSLFYQWTICLLLLLPLVPPPHLQLQPTKIKIKMGFDSTITKKLQKILPTWSNKSIHIPLFLSLSPSLSRQRRSW